jgi:acyl phosphate:glycerol-3-phosphate acyltransferase
MIYLAIILSYVCGAIPFGVIVGSLRGVDIRAVGSGNIGATNVWRALGPRAGGTVFALDVAKGLAGPFIARALVGDQPATIATCAAMAVLGHTFSVFLQFRGGKGIATAFGAMLGLVPFIALGCLAVWGIVLLLSRTISVASIAACVAAPAATFLVREPRPYLIVIGLFATVALIKHIPNMKRLASGTEPAIGDKNRHQSDGRMTTET